MKVKHLSLATNYKVILGMSINLSFIFCVFLVLCTPVKIYVCDVLSECVHTEQAEKFA